ncbi:MAG: heterocyst-inhibiting protein PatX [Hassallia sp.]
MRATISLLITCLVFGSLAFNYQVITNGLSNLLLSFSDSEEFISVEPKPKTRTNQPQQPKPHRGSGRRELMQYVGQTYPAV